MNKREYWVNGRVVVVSRRFLNKATGRMRVRVTRQTLAGQVLSTEYLDYDDMHTGDRAFSEMCQAYQNMMSR